MSTQTESEREYQRAMQSTQVKPDSADGWRWTSDICSGWIEGYQTEEAAKDAAEQSAAEWAEAVRTGDIPDGMI